jgi:hypothetical protein
MVMAIVAAACGITSAAATGGPEYGVRAGLSGTTTLDKNHFTYALPPGGGVIQDAIVVSNYSDEPLTFDIHGADMLTAAGGGLAPAADGAASTLVGTWLTVDHPTLTVPAHQEISAPFTLTVPGGRQPGEYIGAMVVSRRASAPQSISVRTRAALTVDVTVLGTVDLRAAPGPLVALHQRDDVHFTLAVANRGNVLFTFSGEVVVRDGSGSVVATIPVAPGGVYVIPGGQASVSALWHGAPWWGSASATATVHARLASGVLRTFQSDPLQLSFFPWSVVIAAGAGIAGALAALVVLSRRPSWPWPYRGGWRPSVRRG